MYLVSCASTFKRTFPQNCVSVYLFTLLPRHYLERIPSKDKKKFSVEQTSVVLAAASCISCL